MSTKSFVIPVDKTGWKVADGSGEVHFSWEYDENKEKLLNLYEKGKRRQWNATTRVDWDLEIDLDNPLGSGDEFVPIYGSPMWDKLDAKGRAQVKHHLASWQFSQFLHGEQGALICASKIVQNVPDIDSKFYAATQVMDEARHVEVYSKFLDRLEIAYPINPHLKSLLEDTLTDSRWDMTYLGMQVLIEGLALAAFGLIRTFTENELAKSITSYVMQDEARHVAFGRNVLKEYYPTLTQAERNEREEFASEACYLMRDRFLAEEVWETLGFNPKECIKFVRESEGQTSFRSLLFMRIVPILKDVALWGPTMRETFEKMGVMIFADNDIDAAMADDERIAEEIDAARVAQVAETIEAGAGPE